MQKFTAIIEARMNSTRLPGKILYRAYNKPFLWHLIKRLKKVKQINQIILATTKNPIDNILVKEAKKIKINFFRGTEDNVKKRVLDAMILFESTNSNLLLFFT